MVVLAVRADFLLLHREFGEAALAWKRHGHEPSAVFGGARLALVEDWAGHHPGQLTDLEQAFLAASRAARDAEAAARRRRTRRLYATIAALATLLVATTIAGTVAFRQSRIAQEALRIALSRQLSAESQRLLASNPDLAALLAVEAFHTESTGEAAVALTAAGRAGLPQHLTGHTDWVGAVVFSPDGRTVATASTTAPPGCGMPDTRWMRHRPRSAI